MGENVRGGNPISVHMAISIKWAIAISVFLAGVTAIVVHYLHTRSGGYTKSEPYTPEDYEPEGTSALPSAVTEAQRTLDQALQTHSEQSKKATQMAQINGLILTVLIGVVANFEIKGVSQYLVFVGGGLFTISTILAVLGTMGHTMTIGAKPTDFDYILDYDLNEDQYLLWMLNRGYRDWIEDGKMKVAKKRNLVRWSILTFLFGVILVAVGFFLVFDLV